MDLNTSYEAVKHNGLLTADQSLLLKQAITLLREEQQRRGETSGIVDYGFVVFSAAKAYEGFLKTFFYQMGLISTYLFRDIHFRIGKALNPDLPDRFQNQMWLYDDLCQICDRETARQLWQTWRSSRNQIFHYFPDNHGFTTLYQAQEEVAAILAAIQAASKCEVKRKLNE